MKTKQTLLAAASRMALITAAATGFSHAEPTISADNGIDLLTTGYIYNLPALEGGLADYLQDCAGYVIPVSQLTGLKGDGSQLAYYDLVPLKTSRIEIVTGSGSIAPTGTAVIIDGNGIETNSLIVDGPSVLKGQVIIEQPQGDISMGIYQ
jgi:hypothetical protein